MFNRMKKWLKDKITVLSVAMANVEKNALGQRAEALSDDVNHVRRNTEGQLADSLIQGEVTQEVMDLRWRTYKILKETDGLTSEIVGYDEDGFPITRTYKKDKTKGLENVKLDKYDSYQIEMCLFNDEITLSISDTLGTKYVEGKEESIKVKKDENAVGSISGDKYFAFYKPKRHITVERNFAPKFEIETYTKKLIVRYIDEETRLLEFYVSKYPDEYKKTSKFFLKEIEKAIKNPISVNMLDLSKVSFITNGVIGSDDFLLYQYTNLVFDKIIEFDGNYVVKFKANIDINGEDILEKHRQEELDKKYENKERKK